MERKTLINITYSHKLGNISPQYEIYNDLFIIGHGVDISCSAYSFIDILGCGFRSLKMQGITWKKCDSVTLKEYVSYKE